MNFPFPWGQVDQPTGGITLAAIGVIGAIVVGIWQRISAANVRLESERMVRAVEGCERRYKDLENRLWLTQEQLRESERKAAQWQTRCESLGWSDGPRNSAPRKDPA